MSGVRESTLAEEIRDLKDLGVEDHVIKRMMDKYNRMLTDHGDTCNRIREEVYREVRGGAGGERNYHKSINNSYKRERATVRGSSIF